MIKSMTGYGRAEGASGMVGISIEIKSVNNRHFDCAIKMPRVYSPFEETMKSAVHKHISRGKVDVFVSIDSSNAGDIDIKVNVPLADAYVAALKELSARFGLPENFNVTDIARFPDILLAEKKETDIERLGADICAVLEDALKDFDEMRAREGGRMQLDVAARLDEIDRLTAMTEEISPKTVAEYREKLEARMRDILQSVELDESRVLTEAALFADRTAINEETVRLRSHMSQLRDLLESAEPVGRKMDFLVQEFNREANTIGSKGNDAQMAKVVVDLKAEIEKIREQAQNVE